jgi:hypothetical protein
VNRFVRPGSFPPFELTVFCGLWVNSGTSCLSFIRVVYLFDYLTFARFALMTVLGSGLCTDFVVRNDVLLEAGFECPLSIFPNVPEYRSPSISTVRPYPSKVFYSMRCDASLLLLLLSDDEWMSAPSSSSSESHLCIKLTFSFLLNK